MPWKQIIQTMTGHKSNSNLKPLISLKEIFFLFFHFFFLLFAFQERRGRKGQKVVKQWDLLVRTGGGRIVTHSSKGVGAGRRKKQK